LAGAFTGGFAAGTILISIMSTTKDKRTRYIPGLTAGFAAVRSDSQIQHSSKKRKAKKNIPGLAGALAFAGGFAATRNSN
jgi:hypothetical protein